MERRLRHTQAVYGMRAHRVRRSRVPTQRRTVAAVAVFLLLLFPVGRERPFSEAERFLICSNNTDAGSSVGSWGTSSPRKALARIDWVSLSTCAFAVR